MRGTYDRKKYSNREQKMKKNIKQEREIEQKHGKRHVKKNIQQCVA